MVWKVIQKDYSSKLRFYAGNHTYYVGRTKLKSVTTLVGEHFPKFDAKRLAKKIANGFKSRNWKKVKAGIEVTPLEKKKATQKYWKNEWKAAAQHGTDTHNLIEEHLLGKESDEEFEERTLNKFKQGKLWLEEFESRFTEPINLMPELQLYSKELGLAGTIDLMVINNDNEITLIDWKTNKEITKKNKYNEFGISEITKDIDSTSFNKYSMQLLIYALMVKEHYPDLKVTKLLIVHLKEDSYQEINVEIDNYLKEKILLLVEANKNDKNK